MRIRTRITFFGVGVVAIVLTCFSAASYALIVAGLPRDQDKQLQARANEAVASVLAAPARSLVPSPALAPVDPATSDEIFVIVLDNAGKVLSHTGARAPGLPAALLTAVSERGPLASTVTMDGVPVRVFVRAWHRADLGRSGFVAAAQAIMRQRSDRQGLAAILVISAIVTLIGSAVAIWFVSGRALRPLRVLTTMVDEIGRSQNLGRRLPVTPQRDDVGRLTWSFNAMMDQLQQALQHTADALAAQQHFTADASHELRTPLTTIISNAGFLRANPEAAPGDRAAALDDIESESIRMGRLVADLLTLARADGGQHLRLSTVDLGALTHEVCRQAKALHPTRELHCAGAPTVISGDVDALTQLLWIMLENAVNHTEDGGNIWIAVTRHGTGVMIQVADDGTGIDPAEQARIFNRFYRADASRSPGGAGLGLSIAAWITREHGGTITAANNDRGGATFVLQLPAAPPTLPATALSSDS
jgi:signal transduction histidine kinase